MPQITPGGKYIYGWSRVNLYSEFYIPPETMNEYQFEENTNVIVISGSKTSRGICLANRARMLNSKLEGLFTQFPDLSENADWCEKIHHYKGRLYTTIKISNGGRLVLNASIKQHFGINPNDNLLLIRGSHLACVCALCGPLVTRARSTTLLQQFE
ncbi:MAG: hypothetical protein LWX83_16505 [Anaerolineae bacterium]|nr:hypothetical protein [Anaerolineae bacterium]